MLPVLEKQQTNDYIDVSQLFVCFLVEILMYGFKIASTTLDTTEKKLGRG